MSSYFLGYVEIRREADSDWELYRFPDKENSPEGSAYVCQGYVRDCLSRGELGNPLMSKADETYKPKEYDPGDPNGHPLFRRDRRLLIAEPMSPELKAMIEHEWDPDNDEPWGYRQWKKVTLGDISDLAQKCFDDNLKYLIDTYIKENKDGICRRLETLEGAINKLIGKNDGMPTGIYGNLGITDELDKNNEDDDDEKFSHWDIEMRQEARESLNFDVGALNELYGFLYGIKDINDFKDARFIAVID